MDENRQRVVEMSERLHKAQSSNLQWEKLVMDELWANGMQIAWLMERLESQSQVAQHRHPYRVLGSMGQTEPAIAESEMVTQSSSQATAPTVDDPSGSSTSLPRFSLVRTDHRGSQVLASTSAAPSSTLTVGDVLKRLLVLSWTQPAHETQGSPLQFGPVPLTAPELARAGLSVGGGECGHRTMSDSPAWDGRTGICRICGQDAFSPPSSPSTDIHAQGERP